MALGITVMIVAVLIIAVWVVIEMKRMRHKLLAIFLIGLILFSYLSINFVFKEKEIDFLSVDGIKTAATMYFSWMGTVFSNLKTITSNSIGLDWKGNETG